jgi:S-adenosylmethionine hydrolase
LGFLDLSWQACYSNQAFRIYFPESIELRIITLLTDFGIQDGYHGVMKGVIWGIAPSAQIADLTHSIQPQNVLEGALVLGRAAPYFPPGSIHLAVVDPGVGTHRRPMAAQLGAYYFVGPDNGLCTLLLEQARSQGKLVQVVHIDKPEYWLPEISNVFHGRDIFAPVAAHLANGVPLADLGTPISDLALIEIPQPQRTERGWRGIILQIDVFGNLATNLGPQHFQTTGSDVQIHLGGEVIHGLVRAFGDGKPSELVALFDSSGMLNICVVNGNAAKRLQAQVGNPVEITIKKDDISLGV